MIGGNMSLYDGIKDVAKVIQKADNIDLYKQLLDLGQQALDMQAEISRLREENINLRKEHDLETRIERHSMPYITLLDDPLQISFCAVCWATDKKLIQMNEFEYYGSLRLRCKKCDNDRRIY